MVPDSHSVPGIEFETVHRCLPSTKPAKLSRLELSRSMHLGRCNSRVAHLALRLKRI